MATFATTSDLALQPAPMLDELAEQLRLPVRAVLAERAARIRRALPARPDTPRARYAWWRSLSPAQARQAVILDLLDSLHGHLSGQPAPGFAPDDRLPTVALEEADGFTEFASAVGVPGGVLDAMIDSYRRQATVSQPDA